MRPRLFKNRDEWRNWLEHNHATADEIWLLFYEKHTHTGKKTLKYDEAVEEALCFGWIDSKLRRIDDRKHYLWWVQSAKKPETRRDRIEKVAQRARDNLKPGM